MILEVDEYISNVIKKGDEGSELLAALCAPTLKNSEYIEVLSSGVGGLAVLRVPEGYNVAAHTSTGNPDRLDVVEHTESLMDNLYRDAEAFGSKPLAVVDVVDASEGQKEILRKIGETLATKADEGRIAVINGELAILGSRVTCDANISGTLKIGRAHV